MSGLEHCGELQHQPDSASLELGAYGPQALGAGVGAHTLDDGFAVCLQQGLHADLGVLAEAILHGAPSLGAAPAQAASLRVAEEVVRQGEGPALEAGVPELQRAEFRLGPALGMVRALARGRRRPSRQPCSRRLGAWAGSM